MNNEAKNQGPPSNTYTSKLSLHQTAWFLEDNRVVSETYGFRRIDHEKRFKDWQTLPAPWVFATKAELLASL